MTLGELRDIMGAEALRAFLGEYGGIRVYIPAAKALTPSHPMCGVAGFEAVYALAVEFGGCAYDMPTAARFEAMDRKLEILRRRAAGETFDTIARAMKISNRYVAIVCAEGRKGLDADACATGSGGTGGRPANAGQRQLELF